MKLLLRSWMVSFCLVAGLLFLSLLLPAAVSADQQVDVCYGGGTGAAECDEFVDRYLNPLIVVLTALVGIAAVISIIMAGIQYSTSADDPGAVSKAKQRILNTVIGLVAYIFLLAFLYWLIPGGSF